MYEKESLFPTMDFLFNFFRKKQTVQVGQLGIYRDVVIIDTLNDGNKSIKYEFFVKVKAVGVYDKLVEIEVLDISTSNTCNQSVFDIVQDNIPKYIDPKLIKWELRNFTQSSATNSNKISVTCEACYQDGPIEISHLK